MLEQHRVLLRHRRKNSFQLRTVGVSTIRSRLEQRQEVFDGHDRLRQLEQKQLLISQPTGSRKLSHGSPRSIAIDSRSSAATSLAPRSQPSKEVSSGCQLSADARRRDAVKLRGSLAAAAGELPV